MFNSRALLAALSLTLLCMTPAIAKTRVAVPDGTPVAVQVIAPVNSGENNVNDIVQIQVVNDVIVGGWIIVPAGAKGQAHVTKVDQAGGHGHAGSLEIVCDYVVSADGGKLRLQPIPFTAEGKKSHGGATVAGIFTYGLASNAIKGGDASFNATRTLAAMIQGPVHVMALKKGTAASGDGFDH